MTNWNFIIENRRNMTAIPDLIFFVELNLKHLFTLMLTSTGKLSDQQHDYFEWKKFLSASLYKGDLYDNFKILQLNEINPKQCHSFIEVIYTFAQYKDTLTRFSSLFWVITTFQKIKWKRKDKFRTKVTKACNLHHSFKYCVFRRLW